MNTSRPSPLNKNPRSRIARKQSYFLISAVLALAGLFASVRFADAASLTWTNTGGGDWSVGANWNPAGPPVSSSDLIFGDGTEGSTNTDDLSSATIDSLTYNQDNGSNQTTIIPSGQTLTISSGVAAGSSELYVGSTSAATTSSTQVPVKIAGTDLTSTLDLTGAGDIWVAQGNSTSGSHMATLNMSGLGTFNASVGRLFVGVNINGINRPSGTLLLAQTNTITLTGSSPQVEVQESPVNANGGTISVLSFGQVNFLNANTLRLGGDKGNANINFAAAASSAPTLKIRNSDGVSPCTVIDFGYNAFVSTGNSTVSTADFSAGSVDLLANLVHIPQGPVGTGTGTSTGTVTLGAGAFNVADLEIGWGNATGASGTTTGTLNVNNNGLFSTGAVVTCSTVLNLARTNGGSAAVTGTLSITGGTVIANAITSGGGVSGINISTGTLLVSNTVGSLSRPIRTFGVGGATLDVPLSFTGSAITVSNLITGAQSLVNITAVPDIGSYPVTFTLIQYQGTEDGAGAGTFTLNSLPAATPNYVGTILDTSNGVVQVQLTAGPTTVLSTTWTGATDNNWNYTTPNWLYQGVAADFVDGRSTIFDDTSTQTNILLDASPLSPSSVTVTNNSRQYTFGGTGFLSSGTLVKSGSSSLTLDNSGGDNNIPTVVINGGTLQLGAGDANGGLSSVNITNNGALVVDSTNSVNLSSSITGSGTLTQGGGGTLVLSGANSYNGTTSATNGTLEIDQTTAGTGAVNTSSGTVLSGIGVVGGPVTVGGELSPGTSTGGLGTFQAGGGLTLSAGSTGNFGLNATVPTSGDSVAVTGNLAVNNNAIDVSFNGVPSDGSYPLFTYTGTLSGSFNPAVTGTHFTAAVDTNTLGAVNLDLSGSGYALEWNSTSGNEWDNVSTNWNNLGNSTPSTFLSGDSVLFDDTLGVVTTIDIPSGTTVFPLSITDTATNNFFTISGAGHIGGSSGIVKSGLSILAIGTANSFTGPVDIQQGVLQTQNGAALGNASSVTVESNATLDVDGQNLGGAVITASGPGAGGGGAVVNTGASDTQALRQLVLTGDTTIGGSGLLEMNNSGGTASLSTGGNPYNLTKVGANEWDFQNLATFDTALSNIDIQAGSLMFNGSTPGMGATNATLTVETGATLSFGNNQIVFNKQFVFNGDGSTVNLNNGGGANDVLAGPITLNGDCVFSIGGTQLIVSNTINGSGGLIKSGTSPLILTAPISYAGNTVVNAGSLVLDGVTLSTSPTVTVAAGATLNTGGAGLTLANGQTLNGNGTVTSGLVAGAGSTVSPAVTPGSSPVGVLTVSGAISLSGTNIMQVDPVNGTNDVLASTASISYGGTLNLTALSSLSSGNSFKLFNASSYSGSFGSIIPATPGPGLAWNTSALNTSGTIGVVSSAPPKFTGVKLSGGNIVLVGSNGVASGTYYVLTSTNLASALATWTPIATNTFNTDGSFSFTNSLMPPTPRQFYLLELPGGN